MPFDPALTDPKDRIRLTLGDITLPELMADATYLAMLAYHGDDEQKATVALARSLVAQFSQKATSISLIDGTQMTWRDRLIAWREVIETLDTGVGSGVSSGLTLLTPTREPEVAEYVRDDTWWT